MTTPRSTATRPPRQSKLAPAGMALIALGIVGPTVLRQAAQEATGPARAVTLIGTDVLAAGFFLGIAFLVIGKLRNRRWRQEAEAAARSLAPPPGDRGATGPG